MAGWDKYGRWGIDLAASATSLGFTVAKTGTKLGFSITREVASATLGLTASAFDHAFFGGMSIATPLVEGTVATAITLAEKMTLAPLFLGEYITATSLLAAHSSINVLSVIFPGSNEASFSLASFITLVKREWNEPAYGEHLPVKRFGVTEVARALVAWGALQGVTQEWQERKWLKYLLEVKVEDPPQRDTIGRSDSTVGRIRKDSSRVRVTSDVIFSRNIGQIISADIGEAPTNLPRPRSLNFERQQTFPTVKPQMKRQRVGLTRLSHEEMKSTLRRLSKMVLAGYGGASLLFFGVSPTAASPSSRRSSAGKRAEEAQLAHAIESSEAEAAGDNEEFDEGSDPDLSYSWWDILLGKHDHEIFERFANTPVEQAQKEAHATMKATAVIGIEHQMPRFWVLTDHGRRQIVLVLRGTMSLNELAVDLTCEPEEFEPATTVSATLEDMEEERVPFPGHLPIPGTNYRRFPRTSFSSTWSTSPPRYQVHGGMLRMAKVMGEIGRPVQVAVRDALARNDDYELVLCGHSLGAGVAALLGMMWADPKTCRTVRSSGLPVGRRTSVFCFAPPCISDPALSTLASNLVVSLVYSHDVVARLSLGSVRDIKNASLWLCEAHDRSDAEGYSSITQRARKWKAGQGSPDDPNWFIAVRKTLEASMSMRDLFPPGRVLWARRDSDFHPAHRQHLLDTTSGGKDKLRLFEVLDVEKVFGQIVFAKDMLSAHLPHQYDRALHELL
ncbi:hypothetical protein PLICRDRAFT_48988 [Plicaturopsis crispa FD-325 SS-3]|nr:hypothetical protein PLICRDRAFT_48988 [Plicaturopsis crispa FD-325 SS-3]